MGRTLKRVPLSFDWPHNKTWEGYLNPYYRHRIECLVCKGNGYSPEGNRFRDEWYGHSDPPFDAAAYGAVPLSEHNERIEAMARRNVERYPEYYGRGEYAVLRESYRLYGLMRHQWSHQLIQADVDALVAAGRLHDFTRVPRTEEQREQQRRQLENREGYWLKEPNGYHPTAAEVNEWSIGGMGHDSINQLICVEARCKRAGVSHTCAACYGEGHTWDTLQNQQAYEAWQAYEPPEGEGYQLWQTTSEGSPISPVFATLDELCEWCADNATVIADVKVTAAEWRKMLDENYVYHQEGDMVFL